MNTSVKRTKLACYTTNLTMSVLGNLSPLLFITFHELYHISYSLLGLLVLVNFSTQLTVDLIFSFFSHKFNIPLTVKLTPLLSVVGLIVYAVWPFLFPNAIYAGLVVGTVIFSASGGLAEVLISPVIAALPSDNPEREMSKLHSVYAWGVVGMILVSTLFLLFFGGEAWQWLALLWTLVPLISLTLFSRAKLPSLQTPQKTDGVLSMLKNKSLWLCVVAIFLGGASECTMAQWASGYLEQAVGIPKIWGDIFGVALFSVMLGLGRTLYAKYGKNIEKVLVFSAVGATLCYLCAAVFSNPLIGLLSCAMTGLFTAMLWPGCLIVADHKIPAGGVFIYAMMASGGDLGASIGPQLVGIITDTVENSAAAVNLALQLGGSPEQLGLKLGMLVGMLFPLVAIIVYSIILKERKAL